LFPRFFLFSHIVIPPNSLTLHGHCFCYGVFYMKFVIRDYDLVSYL
jgi:hypothetical protein